MYEYPAMNTEPEIKNLYYNNVPLSSKTSSLRSLDQALSWFLHCRAHHATCNRFADRQRLESWRPTRLIDVGLEDQSLWRLVITAEDDLQSAAYMTLSHCWGSSPPFTLKKSTYDDFRRGRPVSVLSRTFRHAVAVARHFSVRYLWIDSLCIQQDSPDDWLRESVTMQDVYGHGICNIAAAASSNPEGGLFRVRDMSILNPGVFFPCWETHDIYYITHGGYWQEQISGAPLRQRGWVLQERLLASRAIEFGEQQVFWFCHEDGEESQRCEAFPRGIPSVLGSPHPHPISLSSLFRTTSLEERHENLMPLDHWKLWNRIVNEYSALALSKPSDKLVALSGIAQLFSAQSKDQYLAGLWRSRLIESLAWYIPFGTPSKPRPPYRAPTWSWASHDSGRFITHEQSPLFPHHLRLASVVDAQTTPIGDSTGQIADGFILIRGPVLKLFASDRSDTYLQYHVNSRTEPMTVSVSPDVPGGSFLRPLRLFYLMLNAYCSNNFANPCNPGYSTGLVLQPVPDRAQTYTRVGFAEMGWSSKQLGSLGIRIIHGARVIMDVDPPIVEII